MNKLYPVNLNIQGKRCVVVGGGGVALRKTEVLLDCGAEVIVVSPNVCEQIAELIKKKRLVWFEKCYEVGDIDGAMLCFAATDSKTVQAMVKEDAKAKSIYLNSADDPDGSDFHVPSKINKGGLQITISTGGGSPALAKQIRIGLEKEFGDEYALMVLLLQLVRNKVVVHGRESVKNKKLFDELLEGEMILKLLKKKDWSGLQERLKGILPPEISIDNILLSLNTYVRSD